MPKKNTKPSIQKGVVQPDAINKKVARKFVKRKKQQLSVAAYVAAIRSGDRIALGRAITMIESTRSDHQLLATQLVEACLPYTGNSIRIGITGTPGVGKSTFIEAFGNYVLTQGRKLATLAIDPTSQLTRGSILGDKTRMATLAVHPDAFIRPSPAGDSLGGVARKTRETLLLCEAAGYDIIFIETVGVGQSEIAVHSMVDFFLLLLLPGGGDELQGIKRGIVEMADMLVVNKADGDRITLAKQSKQAYRNALHLFPPKANNWIPKVVTCSALEQKGIEAVWEIVAQYYEQMQAEKLFEKNRKKQAKYWLYESIRANLLQYFFEQEAVKNNLESIEAAVLSGAISPFKGAAELLKHIKSK